MVSPTECPRCRGALVKGSLRYDDDDYCMNCGWRSLDLPDNVLGEFLEYYGDPHLEGYKARNTIGTGQPAMTGHERRQRETRDTPEP